MPVALEGRGAGQLRGDGLNADPPLASPVRLPQAAPVRVDVADAFRAERLAILVQDPSF